MTAPAIAMLLITDTIEIPASEIDIAPIRASGPGGQNVNKVSSAVHLRFDLHASQSLPAAAKSRLLASGDSRITGDGVIVIKAQGSRSQAQNKAEALNRLATMLREALREPKTRRPTKPTRQSREKRLKDKAHRAQVKQSRRPVGDD